MFIPGGKKKESVKWQNQLDNAKKILATATDGSVEFTEASKKAEEAMSTLSQLKDPSGGEFSTDLAKTLSEINGKGAYGTFEGPDQKDLNNLFDALSKKYTKDGKTEMGISDIKTSVPEAFVSDMVKKAQDRKQFNYMQQTSDEDVMGFQGLQKPVSVTHAGAVVLHPNETILPASMGNFQTKPTVMGGQAAGTNAGGGTNNNFQINASDYVLANRLKKAIENTVREILYKDQVNNLG